MGPDTLQLVATRRTLGALSTHLTNHLKVIEPGGGCADTCRTNKSCGRRRDRAQKKGQGCSSSAQAAAVPPTTSGVRGGEPYCRKWPRAPVTIMRVTHHGFVALAHSRCSCGRCFSSPRESPGCSTVANLHQLWNCHRWMVD